MNELETQITFEQSLSQEEGQVDDTLGNDIMCDSIGKTRHSNVDWVFAAPDKRATSWVWNGHVKKLHDSSHNGHVKQLNDSSHSGMKDYFSCKYCEKVVKEPTYKHRGFMDNWIVYGSEFMNRYLK